MKRLGIPLVRRFIKSERGQSAVVVMLTASTMIALSAASIETGHIYFAYQELVASTNVAALAGAQAMPNTTQASTLVTTYSAQTGRPERKPDAEERHGDADLRLPELGDQQPQRRLPDLHGRGRRLQRVEGDADRDHPLVVRRADRHEADECSRRRRWRPWPGGQNRPWNIAIILDTTASMGSSDGGAQCSGTRESCAQQGVQMLLSDLYPCALGQTCTATSPAPTPVDNVSLFVFPAVTTTTASKDYVCQTSNPTIVAYTFPDARTAYTSGTAPASNFLLPTGDEYQILGFTINYKVTDTSTSLNQARRRWWIAVGDSGRTTAATGSGGRRAAKEPITRRRSIPRRRRWWRSRRPTRTPRMPSSC